MASSPEEMEVLFRSSKSNQNLERLKDIFGGYCVENKQHKAYSIALDFYDMAKPMLDELAENYEYDFLYDVLLVLCCEEDKDRAIALAVMLIDQYNQTSEYEKIMAVNTMLKDTFKTTRTTTPSVIILKAAINAALCIVEEITDELPSDELTTTICETLSFLPTCLYDVDFMLTSLNRIAACYTSEYKPKLMIIAAFLPALGQIGILCVTDKQFGQMELFQGKKEKQVTTPYQQLELF